MRRKVFLELKYPARGQPKHVKNLDYGTNSCRVNRPLDSGTVAQLFEHREQRADLIHTQASGRVPSVLAVTARHFALPAQGRAHLWLTPD